MDEVEKTAVPDATKIAVPAGVSLVAGWLAAEAEPTKTHCSTSSGVSEECDSVDTNYSEDYTRMTDIGSDDCRTPPAVNECSSRSSNGSADDCCFEETDSLDTLGGSSDDREASPPQLYSTAFKGVCVDGARLDCPEAVKPPLPTLTLDVTAGVEGLPDPPASPDDDDDDEDPHYSHHHANGTIDEGQATQSDCNNCYDGNSFEDREFDFLRTEPVKRSTSLKTYKTPPGTPHRKKGVRFADALGLDLESVRHILNLEAPPKIPAAALRHLKVESESETSRYAAGSRYLTACFSQPGACPDFPRRVVTAKVSLENCLVNGTEMLITGTVRVSNISFHKKVMVRYSSNNWLTEDDLHASYVANSNDGPTDRFCFTLGIPQAFGVGSKLQFCVMYTAGGDTYWDNNYGNNYSVECYDRVVPFQEHHEQSWLHFL